MIEAPVLAFVNHLLAAELWAREKLAPFTGKRVRVKALPLPDLVFAVTADGTLGAALEGDSDLTVTISPADLPGLLQGDDAVLRSIGFTGDAELAAALQYLARHLRWEAEEDLSRVVGDVAAHRIAGAARELLAWQKDAGGRLGENVAEYLTEEAGLLAPPAALARFGREVADLVDALERLEKRLERIDAKLRAR
ncbi:MAG TPA: SCP2 sterol-binding domain-containing protein [Burkholderiales bacterium]|nr:SCP2 sterol-binding domain-containing protein [Burkholderiales bacterium]